MYLGSYTGDFFIQKCLSYNVDAVVKTTWQWTGIFIDTSGQSTQTFTGIPHIPEEQEQLIIADKQAMMEACFAIQPELIIEDPLIIHEPEEEVEEEIEEVEEDIEEVEEIDPELLALGRMFWDAQCAFCHGANGECAALDPTLVLPGECTVPDAGGCEDIAIMADYIAATMPPPGGTCLEDCATATATLIFSSFQDNTVE